MLINLYCLIAIIAIKKLRSLDFFLVAIQTVVDLLISGALSFVFFYSQTMEAMREYCSEKRSFEDDDSQLGNTDYERLNANLQYVGKSSDLF